MTRCRSCGKPIVFMRTSAGRSMPCEPDLQFYWRNPEGSQTVINHAGELVRCELKGAMDESSGLGRVIHWGICDNPDRFRKRRKK